MKCPICETSIKHLIKVIDDISVYQCDSCYAAILKNDRESIKENKQWYSFKEYQAEEKRLEKRLKKIAKIIVRYKKKGELLDIGAGFGHLSSILNKLGRFQINLVEPLVKPKYLLDKNITLHKTDYEHFLSKQKFDLVLMVDVIEHFQNPVRNLLRTKKILKKRGYLMIQTPNYKSLMAKICRNWSWWMPQDHKLLFSIRSIKNILETSGFQTVFLMTYEDFHDFKKNLDGNFVGIKNKLLKKLSKGVFLTLFIPIYFLFRQIIWRLGYGGLIFLVAKRYNNNDGK